ncbi:MAG: acyl-CoA dehydrogenase family protein, partial [Ketobacter sp.]
HGFHPDHLRPEVIPNEPAGPAKEHRDYGIFVATGPNIRAGHSIQGANLLDIAPTVLTCYGLPTGEDMDGRVLADIFTECPPLETIESWELVEGETGEHPEGFTISAEESQEALEQLVALGYIDRPEDDSNAAIANCERELEYNLARAYMDARIQRIYGGTSEIMKEIVARSLVGK